MSDGKSYIGPDGEVGELDDHFFAHAKRGRPPMPAAQRKVRMNFMLDADLAERLNGLDNKSAFVTAALRKALAP